MCHADNRSSIRVSLLVSILIFVTGGLIACGGGGSSSSENVSISGQITTDQTTVAARGSRTKNIFYSFKNFELIRSAHAQDSDSTAEPVVGATVDLFDSLGSLVATTTTDENGDFVFLDIAPGDYSIQVSDPSITTPLIIDGVTVLAGDTAEIRGTVTQDGGEVSVEYVVDSCDLVVDNQGQLGHAEALAEAADISVEEVIDLRETNCLGWGVIAQQLEVPPGALGLGNTKVKGGGKPEGVGNGKPDGVGNGKPEDVGNGKPKDNNGKGNGKPDSDSDSDSDSDDE